MKQPTVLFVDDEPHVLTSLERHLVREPYRKLFANNAAEGLNLLERESVQVVVTDMRMPGMDGLTFLQRVRERRPQVVRMVLSGTSEIDRVIGAINSGEVYRYLTKPLSELGEFRAILRQALEFGDLQCRQVELMKDLWESNRELSRWQARMAHELRVAGQVQSRLLSTAPVFSPDYEARFAYRPSLTIGGDFFDALTWPDGRLCLYVGDVSGHGVASALISTLLKMTATDLARTHIEAGPAAICRELNRYMREHILDTELYATLFLAVFDPASQQWRACNCGHPMPIVLGADGALRRDVIPDRGDMPLGIADDLGRYSASAETAWTALPGDVLLLFTDGLYEARHRETQAPCGPENLLRIATEMMSREALFPHPEALLQMLADEGYQLDGDDCCAVTIRLTHPKDVLLRREVDCGLEDVNAAALACEQALRAADWPEVSATALRLLFMEYGVNIVRHGRLTPEDRFQFCLRRHGDFCHLLVRDSGPAWDLPGRLARLAAAEPDHESGRGLGIIQSIASHVDFCRREPYTYARFVVSRQFQGAWEKT